MSIATFRESLRNISVPFLLGFVGVRLGYAVGLVIDAMGDATRESIKARMPGVADVSALPYLGRDRGLFQGPNETPTAFAARLSNSMLARRRSGTAGEALRQLREYFSPSYIAHLYHVSDRSVWHSIDQITGVVTKTRVNPPNWKWDGNSYGITGGSPWWWRVWIILDGTSWVAEGVWGTSTWGDGGTWGCTALPAESTAVNRIVAAFRCAKVQVVNVIVAFTPGMFAPGNTPGSGVMPVGTYDQPATRLTVNAAFWQGAQ